MQKILKKIESYDKIIIFGHKRPDGDCFGSQIGLKHLIKESYPEKQVFVVGEKSEYVNFLGEIDKLFDQDFKGALAIVVDTALKSRISEPRYELCQEIVKIDHHPAVDNYGTINYVDENAAACAEIIAEFYYKYQKRLKLNLEGAQALYVGLITDTGRFRYAAVKKKTFLLAGEMLEFGLDNQKIDYLLNTEKLSQFQYKAHLYNNYKFIEEGFIYLTVTQQTIKDFQVTDEEAAAMVNIIGGIKGFPIWALIIEYPDEIRVRLRSNGPIINKLAEKYQGGGHPLASGAKLDSFEQLADFIEDIKVLLTNYTKDVM
ncbi:MAG: bifunctional oligoribonuclease/PAP phosphatase NrnA [Erysipelotrichales bacterium]|nr:bifunctional oligoribonuclease/PAP phosphatase NrnA [Erysipelotrichales bacterium]